jgi:deoxycytidylate deaminase
MAAVIASRKRIIAVGYNNIRSHPFQKMHSRCEHKIALHAEMDAINKALKIIPEEQLKRTEIYVARILKNGSPAKAKPCTYCQAALDSYGIQSAYWTEYLE